MTDRCIHGFNAQICASCRRCAHGLIDARCGVCNPRTAREAMLMLANDAPRASEEHRGYEIQYVAGERSWYYRADAESAPSRLSFRSAFQARRAIDELLDAGPPKPKRATAKRR
jgi:hypothetical protein